MSNIKKINWKANAELKTIGDYALILQHCNGYSKEDAREGAKKSSGEELFEELLRRNEELFKTGCIIIQ